MAEFSLESEAEDIAARGAMKLIKPVVSAADDIIPIMMRQNQTPQQQQQNKNLQNSYSRVIK